MLPKYTMNKLDGGERAEEHTFLISREGEGRGMGMGYLTQKKPANETLKSPWALAHLSVRKFMPVAII